MSICMNQVLDYLDTHPICQDADNMDSMMDMLMEIYSSHNTLGSGACRDCCRKEATLAFSQGVAVGLLLMTEVQTLP